MAVQFANRVQVSTSSSGTAAFTLSSAVSSAFQSFSAAGIADGSFVMYAAWTATEFECGAGTYNSGTPSLSRDFIYDSSSAGAKVNFSSSPTVTISPLAESPSLGCVTPEMFGAVGDGTTDDTVAWNQCVAFLEGGNYRSVFVGANKNYKITAALDPFTAASSYKTIIGAGPSSQITCTATVAVFTGDTTNGIAFKNLRIVGNSQANQIILATEGCTYIELSDLWIEDIGCLLQHGPSGGSPADKTGGIYVTRVVGSCANVATPLFSLLHGAGFFMSECDIFSEGGVHGQVAGRYCISVENDDFDTVQLFNNTIQLFYQIFRASSTGSHVMGNFFIHDNIIDNATDDCIYLFCESTSAVLGDVSIQGNHIGDPGGYGVHSDGPFNRMVITDNMFITTGAGPVLATYASLGTPQDLICNDNLAVGCGASVGFNFLGINKIQVCNNVLRDHSGFHGPNGVPLNGISFDDVCDNITCYNNDVLGSSVRVFFDSTGATAWRFQGNFGATDYVKDGVALHVPTFTVAALPVSAKVGDMAFATNVRVSGEGAGSGTGGLVTYNGTAWKVAGTNTTAAA